MATAAPIRYAETDGLQIAYQVVGDGPVDLLYVPGAVNHIEAMWDVPEMARFTRRVGSFSRFILMDKRGTGLSDRLPVRLGDAPEDRMDDVRAVLDAVDSSSAWLFATADGTPIAILAAASHPQRVRGLVLYASSARLTATEGYEVGTPPERAERVVARLATTWGDDDSGGGIALMAPSVAEDLRWRTSLARIERRACTPRAAAHYMSVNLQVDVREVLSTVRVPTIVLHCRGDRVYPPAQGRYVADHIDGARLVELDGRDHLFFAENGERVSEEIEAFVTGTPSGANVDRVLATVLVTDVARSTERVAAVGDGRWRALLDAHDEVLHVQVERYRGRVVKTTGDGCLAVFDAPRRAMLAADGARTALAALGLEIHAGLHSGEIELRGTDVAGLAVHLAARVAAEALPGEILVTRTVHDLVVGSTVQFVERGEHRLKGFEEPWRLYRLAAV